jgi:hypothetical protein
MTQKVECPRCGRRVPVTNGRLAVHLRIASWSAAGNCDGPFAPILQEGQ